MSPQRISSIFNCWHHDPLWPKNIRHWENIPCNILKGLARDSLHFDGCTAHTLTSFVHHLICQLRHPILVILNFYDMLTNHCLIKQSANLRLLHAWTPYFTLVRVLDVVNVLSIYPHLVKYWCSWHWHFLFLYLSPFFPLSPSHPFPSIRSSHHAFYHYCSCPNWLCLLHLSGRKGPRPPQLSHTRSPIRD